MTDTLTDKKQTKIVEYIKFLENKKDLKISDSAKSLGMCEAVTQIKMSNGDYERKCKLNDASHIGS